MIWANFLHFYQPPTQKKYWVDRITNEAYLRILKELELHPQAHLTINIAAALLELWDFYGYKGVIEGYRKLVESGQIEVTGSAKFHPLLPKIPDIEVERQILLNELTLNKYLGVVGPLLKSKGITSDNLNLEVRGFFPPEMAFDSRVANIVASLGYKWVICEELSYSREFGKVNYNKLYKAKGSNLLLYYRDRYFSYKVLSGQLGTANLFKEALGSNFEKNIYLLTAMDGETFGHHRPGMEKLLFELYQITDLHTVKISELETKFSEAEEVDVLPSTWALMEKDVEQNVPFARWDDPDNEIHKFQWQLTGLAIAEVHNSNLVKTVVSDVENSDLGTLEELNLTNTEKNVIRARLLLDRALHSDQYWWASARPWWSIEMVERGAFDLLNVIRILLEEEKVEPLVAFNQNSNQFVSATVNKESLHKLSLAWSLYLNIIYLGLDWQRTGRVESMSKKEDEEIRMRTDEGLTRIDPLELNKMIATLKKEMGDVASKAEFERAAQLRDRIKELQAYLPKR